MKKDRDNKLTFTEWWNKLWGRKYLVNHDSKEIHRLERKHINCLKISRKNREFIKEYKALMLISLSDYNGCRWCWKAQDKG